MRGYRVVDNRPVLKHGPRSGSAVRVSDLKNHTRNESECRCERIIRATSTVPLLRLTSMSMADPTRKMVNYA